MTSRTLTIMSVLVLVAAIGVLGWVITRPSGPAASATVSVVAGENFWGDIANQLGGSHVHVTSIISDPSADPHLYESSADNAAAVAGADIIIQNGVGYDDFLTKLTSVPGKSDRQILTVAALLNQTSDGVNPHFWYDLPHVGTVASAIEQALAAKDPADAATFSANLTTFNASLQPLMATIQTIKTQFPGAPVAYTERVPGYLLDAAGLTVKTPAGFAQAVEDGNDPAPADISAFESLISNHQIKLLLYNSQATSDVTQHIRDLATQANIPVVGVSETMPSGVDHYQTWQMNQLQAMLKALQQ